MYWLVGVSIIVAMIGTLTLAEDMATPSNSLIASPLIGLILIVTSILLFFTVQRNATSLSQHAFFKYEARSSRVLFFTAMRYLLMIIVASVLITASTLQALIAYQKAETTKIIEPMRVQAWVTIEGISDSVYNPAIDSGYRQVATLRALKPLTSDLTSQDLETKTTNYLEDNSLGNDGIDKDRQYRVLLNAYPKKPDKDRQTADFNFLQPGDQLLMTLTLAPIATSEQVLNNPTGFDSYRWLRSRHIDGVASIVATGTPLNSMSSSSGMSTASDLLADSASSSTLKRLRTNIDQWRWQLRQHFYQDWTAKTIAEQQAKAVTLSLLTGDRSLINRDTKDLYQLAGVSHLLAISGTHVLFLAIVLAGAAVLLFNRLCPTLYHMMPRWQVRWWVMISAAFIYALFTGFDVPAARTAWMLLVIGLVRLTLLPISTMQVLLALAVLMAWVDPYVLWQAGYWLSFVAVALLLKYDDTSYQRNETVVLQPHQRSINHDIHKDRRLFTQLWATYKRIFRLQFWLFMALLPITLLLFGKASLWGLLINLFAIGLFGWIIVPLNLLAGLCYLLLPALADSIWALVSTLVAGLHELIMWLTSLRDLSGAWLYTSVNMTMLLIVLLVMLPWLLPRGLISRWLALPPLTLLMMTVYANQQSLATTPTLYLLPTGDRYLSAVVLQYPIIKNQLDESDNNDKMSLSSNTSWLFLADHRPNGQRTMPSTLTADKLSASLEQQLRTLSIKHLEGIIVQTSVPSLTDTLSSKQKDSRGVKNNTELLPMTVLQLSQSLPTNQYWQAGRYERWSAYQRLYLDSKQSAARATISAQRCEQGKTWQLANGALTLRAITGWSMIDDASVWDCTVTIDSNLPIRVLKYNPAEPLKSARATAQTVTSHKSVPEKYQHSTYQDKSSQSRIIVNADTHKRVWQIWSLLCLAEPFTTNTASNYTIQWLGQSTSQISADIIDRQQVDEIITYDDKTLDVAVTLDTEP